MIYMFTLSLSDTYNEGLGLTFRLGGFLFFLLIGQWVNTFPWSMLQFCLMLTVPIFSGIKKVDSFSFFYM